MSWGEALVGIGASLFGGSKASSAASKANKAYQKAMEDIIRQAGVTTGQQGALYQPYGEFGQESLNRLRAFEEGAARGDYTALTASPEYQFALQQGQSDLARNLAARGGLFGGQAQKQFIDYGQGLASTQMQNYLNRLQGGIQTGMAGASGQAQSLGNYLNMYGQARGIQGQSAAGKAVSQGNTWQSVIGDIGKTLIFGPQGWEKAPETKP
jgi:hypothetical protein